MGDITVLGLGLMGTALAESLQKSGHKICVWNRSEDKMTPLINEGATSAASVQEAVLSSPMVLVCVSNYDATVQLLRSDTVLASLGGRTVIQFSTGTPQEALESEIWMNDNGAAYLDGAILASPKDITSSAGKILIGGKEAAWIESEPILGCLGDSIIYTGDNIRAPAILDLAWLTQRLGHYLGLFHGVMLCEAGGVDLEHFSSIIADTRMRQVLEAIGEDDYQNPSVTVNVYLNVLKNIQKYAVEAGVDLEMLDNLRAIMEQACTEGYGDEDIAALAKTFRSTKLH